MKNFYTFLLPYFLLLSLKCCFTSELQTEPNYKSVSLRKKNTVIIAVLVRNKEHTLPYFLTCLEKLNYPKDRISLWITSDHNIDKSIKILEKWLSINEMYYHSVFTNFNNKETRIVGEQGVAHWPFARYSHIISLREKALEYARYHWADFLWMVDSDAFITNPDTLKEMIRKGYAIVAPMLQSGGLYSNFWCGMTSKFYYKRTDDYTPILNRENKGCFQVPMVHSSVLIDLREEFSDRLTYNHNKLPFGYDGPHDDIISFARSANMSGIDMYVCNEEIYGYIMIPLEKGDKLMYDYIQLRNLKLEVLVDGDPLEVSKELREFIVEDDYVHLPFDKAFMISLKRRPERRKRMIECFKVLRMAVETVDAVDGKLVPTSRSLFYLFGCMIFALLHLLLAVGRKKFSN